MAVAMEPNGPNRMRLSDFLFGIRIDFFFIFVPLLVSGVELQLRMAGDSRVLMDHNMEIGVTPAQVNQNEQANLTSLQTKKDNKRQERDRERRGGHKQTGRISRAGERDPRKK